MTRGKEGDFPDRSIIFGALIAAALMQMYNQPLLSPGPAQGRKTPTRIGTDGKRYSNQLPRCPEGTSSPNGGPDLHLAQKPQLQAVFHRTVHFQHGQLADQRSHDPASASYHRERRGRRRDNGFRVRSFVVTFCLGRRYR